MECRNIRNSHSFLLFCGVLGASGRSTIWCGHILSQIDQTLDKIDFVNISLTSWVSKYKTILKFLILDRHPQFSNQSKDKINEEWSKPPQSTKKKYTVEAEYSGCLKVARRMSDRVAHKKQIACPANMSVCWFLGFLVSCFLGFLVSKFHGFLVSKFLGFKVSWFLVSQFLGFKVSKIYQIHISCFSIDNDPIYKIFKNLSDGSSGFIGPHLFDFQKVGCPILWDL